MNTAARLLEAIAARNLDVADVNVEDAASYATDVEAYEGASLTDADWNTVINSYSASGLVLC